MKTKKKNIKKNYKKNIKSSYKNIKGGTRTEEWEECIEIGYKILNNIITNKRVKWGSKEYWDKYDRIINNICNIFYTQNNEIQDNEDFIELIDELFYNYAKETAAPWDSSKSLEEINDFQIICGYGDTLLEDIIKKLQNICSERKIIMSIFVLQRLLPNPNIIPLIIEKI